MGRGKGKGTFGKDKPSVVGDHPIRPAAGDHYKDIFHNPTPMKVPAKFDDHPGGAANIALARRSARPDILFLSYHLGFDFAKITKECEKRDVTIPPRGPFYDDIHSAVLKARKEHPEQEYIYKAWCLITTFMLPYTLGMFMFAPSVFNDLHMAFWFTTYFFNIFHMRHHKGAKLYRIGWLDAITKPIYDVIDNVWGINIEAWIDNHQGSHHVYVSYTNFYVFPTLNYTNDLEDHDVLEPFPFFRVHPEQKLKWYHKYQTFYIPFVFAGVLWTFPFDNILKHGGSPVAFAAYLCYFGIPIYLHGLGTALTHFACTYAFLGPLVTYLFQVSHNHEELGTKNHSMDNIDGWLKLQITEGVSWGGYFPTLVCGGINLQTEHHICPAHDSTLYYYVMPELKKICEKHGVHYVYEPSFFHAIFKYHKWMWIMGNQEQQPTPSQRKHRGGRQDLHRGLRGLHADPVASKCPAGF